MFIEVKNISYRYPSSSDNVLENISICIRENEFIGIIGPTGSGKSTLVQNITGLFKPYSGEVLYKGENIRDKKFNLRNFRQEVCMIFQYPEHQLFEETVIKDISFGPTMKGFTKEEALKEAKWAASLVGIDENLYEKSPFELSGGEQRRVAIAGVIAMRPKVLILDEPTAGLDPMGRKEILKNIKKLYDEGNMSIILVSHNMDDIEELSKRVIVLNNGKIILDDTTENVFKEEELLKSVGLNIPLNIYIINRLREKGFDLSNQASMEELANNIYEQVNR